MVKEIEQNISSYKTNKRNDLEKSIKYNSQQKDELETYYPDFEDDSDDATSIYKRKQELPIEAIEEQLKKYTKLIISKDNGFIIKNNGTPLAAANQIISLICSKIDNK